MRSAALALTHVLAGDSVLQEHTVNASSLLVTHDEAGSRADAAAGMHQRARMLAASATTATGGGGISADVMATQGLAQAFASFQAAAAVLPQPVTAASPPPALVIAPRRPADAGM